MTTAVILCDGYFGKGPGKTAAGLVRKSMRFKILGVIDSAHSGADAGELLDGVPCGIPIISSMEELISKTGDRPEYLIIGVAPIGGRLPNSFRKHIIDALKAGIKVISGLHEKLGEDPEFLAIAKESNVEIEDIRKEPPLENLHHFRNLSKDLPCLRIPVLGTDAAIGKRTAALALTEAFNVLGIRATFIATGQTGLLQGSEFGIPLDAIRGDFVVGELEFEIVRACREKKPKIIIIEGQGALSHPAYVTGSRAIISASAPNGIVLQHAPKRTYMTFHEPELHLPMPTLESEIRLVESTAKAPVVAITLNHQNMTRGEMERTRAEYEQKFGIPCDDVLWSGAERLAKKIATRFDYSF